MDGVHECESNGFSQWLRFGNHGVIAENDPAEQEKSIKFNSLLADLVVFRGTVLGSYAKGQPPNGTANKLAVPQKQR